MAVWNLGSVNADRVYRLPHLLAPGETLAATEFQLGLGGKGANMSVATARAGARVEHIGAIGSDGLWMRERLSDYGVGVAHLSNIGDHSGHAIVALDADGENQIIIVPAANRMLDPAEIETVLDFASAGDIALCQNETNAQVEFAKAAKARGLRMCYAAAPFSVEAVTDILPHADMLVMNAIEAAQLEEALGKSVTEVAVKDIVVTLGADGCRWIETESGAVHDFPSHKVDVMDTTGAGDTFTGYLLAGLDQGLAMADAIDLALRAGAVMVTRLGAADVIPTRDEVENFFPTA